MTNIERTIRKHGLMSALQQAASVKYDAVLPRIVDSTGRLNGDEVRRFIPAQRYRFHVAGTLATGTAGGYDETQRAGTITAFHAHAGTAPTTASCVVQLRDGAGNVLATVTIPVEQTEGRSDGLTVAVNGRTWIGLHITQTGGAADLSAVVTQETA